MRILLVADPGSIHTSGFHNLLLDIGHEVRIFAVNPYFKVYSELKSPRIYAQSSNHVNSRFSQNILYRKKSNKFSRIITRILLRMVRCSSVLDRKLNFRLRYFHLVDLLESWSPQVVISLKLQNEGYFYSDFLKRDASNGTVPWIHFIWGTDLEYYGINSERRREHAPLICQALEQCKFLITDTHRDARNAYNFGFRGEILGTFVAFGGIKPTEILQNLEVKNSRRKVLIKGRAGGLVGRADLVIDAIENFEDNRLNQLDFHVVMPSAILIEKLEAGELSNKRNYHLHVDLPHRDVILLMDQSIFSISGSDVDGTPGFLIESMSRGAIPIHTDMESIREWVTNDVNGFLFENNLESIQLALKRALDSIDFWEQMARRNSMIIQQMANRDLIKVQLSEILMRVSNEPQDIG